MTKASQCWRVWCLLRDQTAHVKPVEAALAGRAQFEFDDQWDPVRLLANQPDIVLCVNDYQYDIVRCLDVARARGIPSLTLQDGILEWRCQYQNPLFAAGGGAPQHQPVMADKIACLGHQSARQIAAWGNTAKVEVTGMPRLDLLLARQTVMPRQPGQRLLVMTAKNPGFTNEQRALTLLSLQELKRHLDGLTGINVCWRVSKAIAQALGVPNQLQQVASAELADQVEQADAVITTPSTAMLETMLLGRPVAALDYHNVPRFVPTAWIISAREQIAPVIAELLAPPATKLAFQKNCLTDCLRTDGSAAARVATLMVRMIELASAQRRQGVPLSLPSHMLNGEQPYALPSLPALGALYPDQPVFQETNAASLQVRLARAENENRRLKTENTQLHARLNIWSQLKQRVGIS